VKPTLVLGIGNILLRDDGVGVHVVEALRTTDLPERVEVVDGGTAGANLVDVIADRERLILIDAVDAGEEPGTIVRMDVDDLIPADGPLSLHQFGIAETIAMARQLGCAPKEMIFFGVQPGEVSPGLELTAAVARAVPRVVEITRSAAQAAAAAAPS